MYAIYCPPTESNRCLFSHVPPSRHPTPSHTTPPTITADRHSNDTSSSGLPNRIVLAQSKAPSNVRPQRSPRARPPVSSLSNSRATAIISEIYSIPLDEEMPDFDHQQSDLAELLDRHPVLASAYFTERERLRRLEEQPGRTISEYYRELDLVDQESPPSPEG